TEGTSGTGAPLGPALKDNFPEVETFARAMEVRSVLVKYENNIFYEDKRLYADNDLFQILTIPFLQGDVKTALLRPATVVITSSIAKKYFGNNNPIGQNITINTKDFEVTGVTEDQPLNSHFEFNMIMSLKTLEEQSNYPFEAWFICNFHTYIRLAPLTDAVSFAKKIDPVINKFYKEDLDIGETLSYVIQPVADIHLYSQMSDELGQAGNPSTLKAFILVSVFILLIACINFTNLTTAKSSIREKEVGIRKTAGANRKQLSIQFLGETFVMSFISILLAIVIIIAILPTFNIIAGTSFVIGDFLNPTVLISLLFLVVVVTILAGIYPALILSSFNPVKVLKGNSQSGSKGFSLRKILVVSQFAISILLVTSSIIIYTQIDFMKNRYLGFDKEQKIIIPVRSKIGDKYEMIKSEFLKDPSFTEASFSSTVPGRDVTGIWTTNIEGRTDKAGVGMSYYYIDPDFIELYGIKVVAGRPFQEDITSDIEHAYMINETAVQSLGWAAPEEAIGKRLVGIDSAQTIIGVVKDFNYAGLQNELEPMVLEWRPESFGYLTLELNKDKVQHALSFAEEKWNELFPGKPYEFHFLDEDFARLYNSEENFARLISYFTLLGFLIASLGLFGLASFLTERRTKEIGVRKVLGASVSGITILVSKEFIKWVLVANILAWPIAYYIMNSWLQDFAYRIQITLWPFLLSGFIALFFAVMTVSFQSIKAAIANPVESLKYE
ncbi:MAG: ABC transporter permease, partial [Ignavibacteria bacterium]